MADGGWRRTEQSGGDGRRADARGDGNGRRGSSDARGGDARDASSGDGQKRPMRGYKDLFAWQKAMDLALLVHRIASRLPNEAADLGGQLCQAAIAVPATIAAGQGQGAAADFMRALGAARGRLAELDTLLLIAVDLGFLKAADLGEADDLINAVRAISQKLVQRLRDGPKDNGAQPSGRRGG